MSAQFIPYSNPKNLAVIRALSQGIIADVEPAEQASLDGMLEDMLENYEQGYISAAETDSKDSGGFGEIDLVTLVVVPLVVTVLKKLFEELIEIGIEKWKEAHKDPAEIQRISQRIEQVVEEEYIIIERQVNSKKARRKEKVIKQTTVRVIRRYLLPEA